MILSISRKTYFDPDSNFGTFFSFSSATSSSSPATSLHCGILATASSANVKISERLVPVFFVKNRMTCACSRITRSRCWSTAHSSRSRFRNPHSNSKSWRDKATNWTSWAAFNFFMALDWSRILDLHSISGGKNRNNGLISRNFCFKNYKIWFNLN